MKLRRDADQNIRRITALGNKNPVKIDVSGGDVTIAYPIKAISSCGGTKIMVTMQGDGESAIANIPLPAPGALRVINVTKIEQTDTDATDILVWPDDEE